MKKPGLKQALLIGLPLLVLTGTGTAALVGNTDSSTKSSVETVSDPVDPVKTQDQAGTPQIEGAAPVVSPQTSQTTGDSPSSSVVGSSPTSSNTSPAPAPSQEPSTPTMVSERFEYRINGNQEEGYCIKSWSDGSTTEKFVGSRPYPAGRVQVHMSC